MTEKELLRNAIIGCAVADALGYPFEFGFPSPNEFCDYYDGADPIVISDDSQMSLFTLEAMVLAYMAKDTSVEGVVSHLTDAYQAWYTTQQQSALPIKDNKIHIRLLRYRDMYVRRAPGNTCLASLESLRVRGTVPDNDRKGAGANMRVVPLAFLNLIGIPSDSAAACEVATGSAMITHKHPILKELMPIQQVLMSNLKGVSDFNEALKATVVVAFPQWLVNMIDNSDNAQGWTADEALGIAIAANSRYTDFKNIMEFCVCRSGDSDTVAAIAGGLWGLSGKPIPDRLWGRVKEKDIIEDFLGWVCTELGIR